MRQFKFDHNDIKAFEILGVSVGFKWKKIQDKFKTKTTPHYNTSLRDSENVQNDSLTIVDIRAVQFRDRHICLNYALDRAAQSLLGSVSDSFGLVELDKFALEPCVEPRPGHFAVPPHPCVLPAGYQSDCCVCWFCRTSKASVSSSDGSSSRRLGGAPWQTCHARANNRCAGAAR